jgi:mannose-6-phosphate isomerase
LLDPDQRLPVHYHPNKSFAKQHLGLDHGKTEAWIILEAPAGSGVGLGFKEAQNKEDLLKLVRSQDSAALLASLRRAEVSVGDAILVPAGVAHAIDAGNGSQPIGRTSGEEASTSRSLRDCVSAQRHTSRSWRAAPN